MRVSLVFRLVGVVGAAVSVLLIFLCSYSGALLSSSSVRGYSCGRIV